MSYSNFPYRIDINKVNSIVDSKDEVLKKSLREFSIERLNEIDADYGIEYEQLTASQILEAIFIASDLSTVYPPKFWCVVDIIIQYFGKPLPNEVWFPDTEELFLTTEIKENTIFANKNFKYPNSTIDPLVVILKQKDFLGLIPQLEKMDTEDGTEEEILFWIENAQEKQEDIVYFVY